MAHSNSHTIGLKSQESKLLDERLEKMSHDFRTPLNIIIGFTELLIDEVPGRINDEQKHCLGDIRESARRLLSLLDNYLEKP